MSDPVSIMIGVLAADTANKLSSKLSNKDEKISEKIRNKDFEAAVKEADKTTIENIYSALTELYHEDELDANKLNQFRSAAQEKHEDAEFTQKKSL